MESPQYSPDGFLVCPYCHHENQDISKASPPEYAAHRKCTPAYRAKQRQRLEALRQRALAVLLAALVWQTYPVPPVPPGPMPLPAPRPPIHCIPDGVGGVYCYPHSMVKP